jgi:hypothetical protein
MKATYYYIIIITAILLLFPNNLFAQDEPIKHRIFTKQGNEFFGIIMEEEADYIILKTEEYGDLKIIKQDIVSRKEVDPAQMVGGEYWGENPQSSRYFWTPNGYGLKEGEGYYQNIWVLYNQVSYGITNNFSLSGGIIPLFFFGGASSPVWIVPKVSIPIEKEKINMSAGAFMAYINDVGGFGLAFSTITFGSRDRNVNMGMGWGYAGDSFAKGPVLSLAFMHRTGRNGYFISENYVFTGEETMALISLGGRRMIQKVGLDFALYIPLVASEFSELVVLPFLGITIPFGNY